MHSFGLAKLPVFAGLISRRAPLLPLRKRRAGRGTRVPSSRNHPMMTRSVSANSFEVVVCSHTIEHVFDDAKLISELYRVLKPGGKCFLLVPQDVYRRGVLDDAERRRPDFPEGTTHVWRYNLDSFVHLVCSAGFRQLEARSLDAFWSERDTLWRPLQIVCSLAFVVLPYRVWEWVDRRSLAKGYDPKQILVVATKEPTR